MQYRSKKLQYSQGPYKYIIGRCHNGWLINFYWHKGSRSEVYDDIMKCLTRIADLAGGLEDIEDLTGEEDDEESV